MTQSPQDRFIEALGIIAQTERAPRISGRILAYLVLAGEARSLTEIATALDISKASASTNVRLLETHGTALRKSRKGSRQDLWRAVPNPHRQILLAMSENFGRHAEQLDEIATDFSRDQADQRQKVIDFSDFYRTSSGFLKSWAESLQQAPSGATPTAPDSAERTDT